MSISQATVPQENHIFKHAHPQVLLAGLFKSNSFSRSATATIGLLMICLMIRGKNRLYSPSVNEHETGGGGGRCKY